MAGSRKEKWHVFPSIARWMRLWIANVPRVRRREEANEVPFASPPPFRPCQSGGGLQQSAATAYRPPSSTTESGDRPTAGCCSPAAFTVQGREREPCYAR